MKRKVDEEESGKQCVDCRECERKLNLGSEHCLRCLCDCIGDRDVEEISFVSGVDTFFKADASAIFVRFAHCVNELNREEERKCKSCPLSGRVLREEVLSDLSEENISFIERKIDATQTECERCQDCISRDKASLDKFNDELKTLMADSLIAAFKLVGA